jgi:excisionase family DNA binding protein
MLERRRIMNNKNIEDYEKMLTVQEVQKHLGLSKNTMTKILAVGSFPKIKIGNRYRIPEQKYLKWLEANMGKEIIL